MSSPAFAPTAEEPPPKGPSRDEDGRLYMLMDGAEFRTHDQLSKLNRDRLSKKGLKPIEEVTFDQLRLCNRDHLRTYCAVYEMRRGEKDQMERDMVRCVAAWHHGKPGYAIEDYRSAPAAPSTGTPHRPSRAPSGSFSAANRGKKRASDQVAAADQSLLRTAAARPETRTIKRSRVSSPPPLAPAPAPAPAAAALLSSAHGAHAPAHHARAPARGPSMSLPPAAAPAPAAAGASAAVPAAAGVAAPLREGNAAAQAPTRMLSIEAQAAQAAAARAAVAAAAAAAAPPPEPVVQPGSFKHYAHAKQAEQRYKMAYNGGGAAIVQVVENAASYFEGRDTSDVKLNKKVSYDRYQFNVDMLNEIFDGPPLETAPAGTAVVADGGTAASYAPVAAAATLASSAVPAGSADADGDTIMKGVTPVKVSKEGADGSAGRGDGQGSEAGLSEGDGRRKALVDGVMHRLAVKMQGRSDADRVAELASMDEAYRRLAKSSEIVEKVPLRSFYALSRARDLGEIEEARRKFEKEQGVAFVEGPRNVVKRTLDPNATLYTPASKLRIVKLNDA